MTSVSIACVNQARQMCSNFLSRALCEADESDWIFQFLHFPHEESLCHLLSVLLPDIALRLHVVYHGCV